MVRRFIESPFVLVCAIVAVCLLGLSVWSDVVNIDNQGNPLPPPVFTPSDDFNPGSGSFFRERDWWRDVAVLRALRDDFATDAEFVQSFSRHRAATAFVIEHRAAWSQPPRDESQGE